MELVAEEERAERLPSRGHSPVQVDLGQPALDGDGVTDADGAVESARGVVRDGKREPIGYLIARFHGHFS